MGLRDRDAETEAGESTPVTLPDSTEVVCGWAGLEAVLVLWVERVRSGGSDETDDPPCCCWVRLPDSPFRRGGTSCTDSLCRSEWRPVSQSDYCNSFKRRISVNIHSHREEDKYNVKAAPALQTEPSPV